MEPERPARSAAHTNLAGARAERAPAGPERMARGPAERREDNPAPGNVRHDRDPHRVRRYCRWPTITADDELRPCGECTGCQLEAQGPTLDDRWRIGADSLEDRIRGEW